MSCSSALISLPAGEAPGGQALPQAGAISCSSLCRHQCQRYFGTAIPLTVIPYGGPAGHCWFFYFFVPKNGSPPPQKYCSCVSGSEPYFWGLQVSGWLRRRSRDHSTGPLCSTPGCWSCPSRGPAPCKGPWASGWARRELKASASSPGASHKGSGHALHWHKPKALLQAALLFLRLQPCSAKQHQA